MKISERLCIDLFAVSNKVQDKAEVKTGSGNYFSCHFGEKP